MSDRRDGWRWVAVVVSTVCHAEGFFWACAPRATQTRHAQKRPWAWHTGLILVALLLLVSAARAAAPIPPVPAQYFNDDTGFVPAATATALNQTLEQFERDTSNQFLVVIEPSLPPDAVLEEYTIACARKWDVGQKGKHNGVVLFLFVRDHQARIEVNEGLEGALPDALCGQIIRNVLAPKLRANDPSGALTDTVEAIIGATKGEYKGNGTTVGESGGGGNGGGLGSGETLLILMLIVLGMFCSAYFMPLGGVLFSGGGMMGGGFSGGGGFGGGGFGGGGGFSGGGGGGGFSGGGASGSW